MEPTTRKQVKSVLHKLSKVTDFEHNNPTAVIDFIEANTELSLADIWASVARNLSSVQLCDRKNVMTSQVAQQEAAFLLCQAKERSRKCDLTKVLGLIDQSIINCPLEPKHLAPLYGLRSMALFESDQTELALVAVNRALCISSESCALHHLYKARYLNKLDRQYEAHRLIKQFLRSHAMYPRAMEEASEEEKTNVELLRKLQIDIEQWISVQNGFTLNDDHDSSELWNDDSEDLFECSYDSEKDDSEQDLQQEEQIMMIADDSPDEYATPNGQQFKNFSFDYRCELQTDTPKGRSLFASEPIPASTTIFREKAYSMAVLNAQRLKRCNFCGRDVANRFWPCQACNQVVYCAEQCATQDWKLGHRFDCGLTSYWSGVTSRSNFHAMHILNHVGVKNMLQIIDEQSSDQQMKAYDLDDYRTDHTQKVVCEADKDSDLVRKGFLAQMCLKDHSDRQGADCLTGSMINAIDCAIMAALAQGYEFDQLSHHQLVQLIGHCFILVRRFLINAFRWSVRRDGNPEKVHIASYFFLMGSMFNHSCEPNADWTIQNNMIFVDTIRDIKPGEEITFSYGPRSCYDYFEQRQLRLASGYHFQCNCTSCLEEASLQPALQCPACPGPVLSNPIESGLDSHCLLCLKQMPGTEQKMCALKRAIDSLRVHGKLLQYALKDGGDSLLESMLKSLDQVRLLIYRKSVHLLESIYILCKVLSRHPDEYRQKQCIQFGTLVDRLLPLKGNSLIVLPAPNSEDYATPSAAYHTSSVLEPNIDHMIFWCSIYRNWIEQKQIVAAPSADPKSWNLFYRMFNFYDRLIVLIEWSLESKKNKLAKAKKHNQKKESKSKINFELISLETEIGGLAQLLRYKQQELEQIKFKYGPLMANEQK